MVSGLCARRYLKKWCIIDTSKKREIETKLSTLYIIQHWWLKTYFMEPGVGSERFSSQNADNLLTLRK